MLKKILPLLLIFITIIFFLKLAISPTFIISNHTSQLIRFSNAQFVINGNDEINESDIKDLKTYYRVEPFNERKHSLYLRKLLRPSEKLNISFSLYLSNADKSLGFSEKPLHSNQEAHCSFKIDTYSDKKVIVTPLKSSNWCLRPVYYIP